LCGAENQGEKMARCLHGCVKEKEDEIERELGIECPRYENGES
jgi:hypothetical protein